MATPKTWSNVAVAMQSAIAAAKTVTAVTLADPGVASSTAHGYTSGDYVVMTANGMTQINGRVFRVDNEITDAFDLEGEDTTLYDAFTSGSAQKLTLGTSIGTIRSITSSGGDFPFIDTTTIHDAVATQIPGTPSAATFSFENVWDVADTGLLAMRAASDVKAKRAFKFTFADGQIMVFNGYVGATLLPGGSAQDLVTTQTVITMHGLPTYYSS